MSHRKHHHHSKKGHCQPKTQYDYIVVGDGASGCVLARLLSDEQPNKKTRFPKVLVLEQGQNQIQQFGYPPNPTVLDAKIITTDSLTDPNSTFNVLTNDPKYATVYDAAINATTQDPILSGRSQTYSTGRGFGGGSTHYYTLAFRGSKVRWNSYAAYLNDSTWSYDALLPTFKSIETYTPNNGGCFDANQRGQWGPLSVIQNVPAALVDPASEDCDIIMKSFAEAPDVGVGYTCDYNSADQPAVGSASLQSYQTTPVVDGYGQYRSWAHNSFLPIGTVIDTFGKGLGDRHLQIVSNATVDRILFRGCKAVGVVYRDAVTESDVRVYANQIVMCAGTINNPCILQRSGVGSAALLNELGIKVTLDNPNVGANMNGNPAVAAAMVGDVNLGPAGMVVGDLHDDSLDPNDPFYYPNDGVRRAEISTIAGDVFSAPGLCFVDIVVFPEKCNGQVKITSQDPLVPPLIDLDMFGDDTTGLVNDSALNRLMQAIRVVKKVADNVPTPMAFPPDAVIEDDTLLADYVKEAASMQSHQVGTCRFGKDATEGVVDSKFRVFGTKNLSICDLSIYPYTVDGNPMFSTITAAKKASHELLKKLK
jgi:choline dehydrogenase